jgi:bacillithiol biosynthesis deacetylase BshB1
MQEPALRSEGALPLPPCDIVAFTAHPDDMELTVSGTLALAVRQGWRAAAVDFSRGELSTRGTPELRDEEALEAAGILGLSCRYNLKLPDGHIRDTDEARKLVVRVLRQLRAKVVIAPPIQDHHPDHMAVAEIVSKSLYLAGVGKYEPLEKPWRPHVLLHYLGSLPAVPDLVVDITSVYEIRRQAILCHASQFHKEGTDEPPTRISHPDFLDAIEGTVRNYGRLIGAAYGEAYTCSLPVPVTDIVSLYSKPPWELPKKES